MSRMNMIIEEKDNSYNLSISFHDENGNEVDNIEIDSFPTYEQAKSRFEYEMIRTF